MTSTNTNLSAVDFVNNSIKNQQLYEETRNYIDECILYLDKTHLTPHTPTLIYEWNFKKSLYDNKIFSKPDVAEAVRSFEEIKGMRFFSKSHGEYVNPINKSLVRIEGEYPSGD